MPELGGLGGDVLGDPGGDGDVSLELGGLEGDMESEVSERFVK